MPRISVMRLAVRHCLSGVMIGMPPPTLASKRKSTSFFSAIANMSLPNCATTSLLAVTTLLPASIARSMYSRAGWMPPMSSTTTSISGSSRISSILSVSLTHPSCGRGFFTSRTSTVLISIGVPTRSVICGRFISSTRMTPDPTVPDPSRPIFILFPIRHTFFP